MIRRQIADQFWLFHQHDHALLAGQLAAHYCNARFAPPTPPADTLRAVSLHDCGWPLHDQNPTLNSDNIPTDVFESPLLVALEVWRNTLNLISTPLPVASSPPLPHSPTPPSNESPYTQLLVSLHHLGLSAFAAGHAHTPLERFELNKFQHREIERQQRLRATLGLSNDIPLRLGLAVQAGDEAEDNLRRNHLILQSMDRISLALLSTEPPFRQIESIVPRVGHAPVTLTFARTSPVSLKIDPWPFDSAALSSELSARVIPARPYLNREDFLSTLASATVEPFRVTVHG